MKDKIILVKVDGKCRSCVFWVNSKCEAPFEGEESCVTFKCYKLAEEEPVKIQTEYEWKEERYKLLQNNDTSSKETAEYLKLQKWIKDYDLTNWKICTRENTKVGDEVRNKETSSVLIVGFIYRQINTFVLESKERDIASDFIFYEIDLNNTEE